LITNGIIGLINLPKIDYDIIIEIFLENTFEN